MDKSDKIILFRIITIFICIAVSVGALMFVIPLYNVWRLELNGKAELKKSEWSKKVLIEEARAKKDSAKLYAEAEIERAKGVAEANKIIGKSLQNNEAYLRYLWINGLQDDSNSIIYVPTEANLPILEATRKAGVK